MTDTKKRRFSFFLVLAMVAVLAACSIINPEEEPAETPAPTETADEPGTTTGEANVESIEVLVLESFPVQVNVIASGILPDGCTSLIDPTPRREGNTFVVNLATSRVDDEVCTQATVPFDKVIPLDVDGLAAGDYTVSVNGITDSFTLEMDNVPAEEETPEATETSEAVETPEETPAAAAETGISGRVWHDLCAVSGGEGGEPAVPSDGCVALDAGGFQANGVRETDEPGIEGIVLSLGEGACPADGLDEATTGASGNYAFDDLDPGTYCVTVDALTGGNESILIPGDWTEPPGDGSGIATATVDVSAGTLSEDIDFGWDYQFLPAADGEATEAKDCTDEAEFVADVTVLDNEVLPPTLVFTKTWRLENIGTCTWTTDYSIVFVSGDQLEAPDQVPMPQEVPPESVVDISLLMTAPDLDGTYRSEWLVQNELGTQFGIPGPFWTQIQVTAAIPENAAHITGLVWSDLCSSPAGEVEEVPEGCVALPDEGYLADGIYDVGEPRITGIGVNLGEGACPATEAVDATITDEYGRFSFTGLDAGTYCVYVDSESSRNASALGSGAWSWPEGADVIASYTIELGELAGSTDSYFGWDYAQD
jgi:hypothetical protein